MDYLCPKCKSNQISIQNDGETNRCFGCGNSFIIKVEKKKQIIRKPTLNEQIIGDCMANGGTVLFDDIRTFEDMSDDPISNGLCHYCYETEGGERAFYTTPSGYYSCEGAYCERAYRRYVEELEESRFLIQEVARMG